MIRWILVFVALAPNCFAQSWCSSGVQAGSNPSVTCACSQSYSASSATIPNGNDARIYSVCYPTAAGAANSMPDLVVIHGGVLIGTFNNNQPIPTANEVAFAQDGWNVYSIAYTVMNNILPTSTINSGDTSIAVKGTVTGSSWYWPTSATPNFGINWDDATGDVMTVTACSPCANTASTMTVSRTAPTSTHATTAHGTFTRTNGSNSVSWPVPANDIAAFFSFLGTCSPTGTVGQNTGACSGFSPPGDPTLISVMGFSTGAAYPMSIFLQSPGCLRGVNCSFLNTALGTPGGSEWNAPWRVNNPRGAVPFVAASPANDLPAIYWVEQVNSTQGA